MAALAAWLNIIGLGVDLVGAALLAYDALYGPSGHQQFTERRTWLAIANSRKQHLVQQIVELSDEGSGSQSDTTSQLRRTLAWLIDVIEGTTTELERWERHDHRTRRCAVLGLVLLMVGFACQGVGSLLVNAP